MTSLHWHRKRNIAVVFATDVLMNIVLTPDVQSGSRVHEAKCQVLRLITMLTAVPVRLHVRVKCGAVRCAANGATKLEGRKVGKVLPVRILQHEDAHRFAHLLVQLRIAEYTARDGAVEAMPIALLVLHEVSDSAGYARLSGCSGAA
jgi:hypothetical protein